MIGAPVACLTSHGFFKLAVFPNAFCNMLPLLTLLKRCLTQEKIHGRRGLNDREKKENGHRWERKEIDRSERCADTLVLTSTFFFTI